ncbi:MAG: InlB B-repeat-containing protein, partial [Saccharofermentans sp.]|nr:InlB B-repeat-containing protein [Saccharofermentans sp.]
LLATGVISFESLYTRNIVLPEGVVEVPNVEGMQHSDAIQAIEDTHLMAMAQGNVISDYIEAGMIVLQDPSGGTFLDENSFVYLTVSSGNGEVIAAVDGIATVPYLIWDTIEDATLKLDMAGLGEPNITEVYDENVAAGLVISQSIDAGAEVPEGTVLDLVVSLGPAPFELPNVVGMAEADARATLAELGLRSTVQYEVDQDGVDGQVLSQNPNANGLVIRGSTVVLRVCVTTDDNTIEVPSVEGMSQAEAVATLENAGFIVTVLENYSADVPVGGVISQSLVGGSTQASGAAITIYVSKGPRTITITFNANRGTVSETTRIVNVGSAIGNLPTPNRQNYEFVGWYTSDEGGTQVSAGTIAGSANITYYAHWADNAYIVTLDDNGGDSGVSQIFAIHGQAYGVLPTPVKDGYRFDGWFTSTTGGSQITSTTIFTGDRNQTLYAHWTRTGFVAYFDANGGSCSFSEIPVTIGQPYGSLPSATREGYTFDGWFTSATGGAGVTSGSVFSGSSDQTIYAHWTARSYTVSFDSNGGSSIPSISVTYGSPYGSLTTPSRDGYTFDGWYTSSTGGSKIESSSVFRGLDNQTLYAHWTVSSYTVSFDSNGGSGVSSISVSYGSPYGTLTSPSRDGHTFDGWYTSSSGGSRIESSSVFSGLANQVLYAHWTPISYTVSFDSNGGSTVPSINVTYGSSYGSLRQPTRDYYTFIGWTNSGVQVDSNTIFTATENQTLVAQWEENPWSEWSSTRPSIVSGRQIQERQSSQISVYHAYGCRWTGYDYGIGATYRYFYATPQELMHWEGQRDFTSFSGYVAHGPGEVWQAVDGVWCYNNSGSTMYVSDAGDGYAITSVEYATEYRYRDR